MSEQDAGSIEAERGADEPDPDTLVAEPGLPVSSISLFDVSLIT
ncbi:MAG: hypothetical protein ACLPKW_17075 [Acetobacteraceae bacterium]